MKKIQPDTFIAGKGEGILIVLSDNCEYFSFIQLQNSTSSHSFKVSHNVESELLSVRFFTLCYIKICLSCTLNGSFTHV